MLENENEKIEKTDSGGGELAISSAIPQKEECEKAKSLVAELLNAMRENLKVEKEEMPNE